MGEEFTFSEPMDPSKWVYQPTLELPKPNHTITFHRRSGDGTINDNNKVGTLDFNGPALVFEGDAEESAKVFIEWIAQMFAVRLKEEYQRGYEDCLTEEAKK